MPKKNHRVTEARNRFSCFEESSRGNDLGAVIAKSGTSVKDLKILLYHAPAAIAILHDRELTFTFANLSYQGMFGRTESALLGKSFNCIFPDQDLSPLRNNINLALETGQIINHPQLELSFTKFGIKKTGFFNILIQPLMNDLGQVTEILLQIIDASESTGNRKKSNRPESEQNKDLHFQRLMDFMPQRLWLYDNRGVLLYQNLQSTIFTGIGSREFSNTGWESFIHPDDLAERNRLWNLALETGKMFEMEIRLKNKEGNFIWHLKRAMPYIDEYGNVTMWIVSNTEIQKTKEDQRKREEYVKVVSHELKTPITSIKGYVQLLLLMANEENTISQQSFFSSLKRIDCQITRLTHLITEVLDFSRIETNKISLKMRSFLVNDLVKEVVQDIRQTLPCHDIVLVQDKTGHVYADRDRIEQVLINFINNAIKYSPGRDKIIVTVCSKVKGMISVSVKDFGIGISKEQHQKIFDRFYRTEGDNENTYAGFGIGLYIARDIIIKHHGFISLESEPERGSDFTFNLPIHN